MLTENLILKSVREPVSLNPKCNKKYSKIFWTKKKNLVIRLNIYAERQFSPVGKGRVSCGQVVRQFHSLTQLLVVILVTSPSLRNISLLINENCNSTEKRCWCFLHLWRKYNIR